MNNSKGKDIYEGGNKLPLIEEFYTIQGEGYHTGEAAYFIRIGGCDIGCSWCDTRFSWMADFHSLTDVKTIAANVAATSAKSVVVTGGEPTLYNLSPLCEVLKQYNIITFIETSGAYLLTGRWDWICLSPKKNKPPLPEIYDKAGELKVIIDKKLDFIWAERESTNVGPDCHLYLQPEWSKQIVIAPEIIRYVKANPKWKISIQAHKFLKIP